jgi:hypothetical protein
LLKAILVRLAWTAYWRLFRGKVRTPGFSGLSRLASLGYREDRVPLG